MRIKIESPRILIVGGDLEIRHEMLLHLHNRQFDCLMVSSTDNAKLLLMSQLFDLVFCELKLLDGSGLALCQHIRQRHLGRTHHYKKENSSAKLRG